MLLYSRGEPGHLDAWLHADLEKQGIHVVSTKDIFSSLDAMNFEGASHFLPRWDHQIAEAVIAETLKPDTQ